MKAGERIVIVGGGAAAAATVEAYRRHGGRASIVMLCGEADPPYERPPLSKEFVRGESAREELPLHPPAWYSERAVDLRLGVRATTLHPGRGEIETDDGAPVGYDACVIAAGSRPRLPGFVSPGMEHVSTIREIADAELLRDRAPRDQRLVVVGSGFIGCEAAISLARTGAKVSLLTMEPLPQLGRLGEDAARRIRDWLEREGVGLECEAELERIEAGGQGVVVTAGRVELTAAHALLALGIQRNVELAREAGLDLLDDAICTDSTMRTSEPSVLAAGDVAAALNASAGRRLKVEHWGEALNHGSAAGATLAGIDEPWGAAPGFWSSLGDRQLKQVAWGDGFDVARLEELGDEAFTVSYERDGELVGLLAHEADEAYEAARESMEAPE